MTEEQIQKIRVACDQMVAALVGKQAFEWWWNSKNKAFSMRTPQEEFLENPKNVYKYLMGHCDGSYY
jgi:hypothetical protein